MRLVIFWIAIISSIFSMQTGSNAEEIWSYQKVKSAYTEYSIDPAYAKEIATIDGVTFIAVPDGSVLSVRPELSANLRRVDSIDKDLLERLRLESVHYRQITHMQSDWLPRHEKAVARYFILSHRDGAIEAELEKHGISKSNNYFRDLSPHLSTDDDITPEIDAWAAEEAKKLGLDVKLIEESRNLVDP